MKPSRRGQKYIAEKMAEFERVQKEGSAMAQAELLPFMVSLATEGERSAVVLGAERINAELTLLFKRFLTPARNKEEDKNLFDREGGALASFARKIELGYRLGLMDSNFRDALNLFRKLRNRFAHATKVETLNDKEPSEVLGKLVAMFQKDNASQIKNLMPFFAAARNHQQEAQLYLVCVMIVLIKMELAMCHLKPFDFFLPLLLSYQKQ